MTKRIITAIFLLISISLGTFSAFSSNTDDVVFEENFESEFSSAPSGWRVIAGTVTRTTEYRSGGNASVSVTDNSTQSSASLISRTITLESGVYYRITVDVMNLSGNGSVFVYLVNASGKQTDTVSTTVTETGKWTTVELTVNPPDTATGIQILLYSGMANKGTTFYDNVRVEKADGESEQEIYAFDIAETSHPRLYFTNAELSELRAIAESDEKGLAGFSGKSCAETLIADADIYLTQTSFSLTYYGTTTKTFSIPFSEQHFTSSPSGYNGGNYPYWQEMGNKMKDLMQTLSLAYAITTEGKYADRAIALAKSLCEWSTWTEYPTVNRTSLETGYFVIGVATVYDLCYDRLAESERDTIATALEEKGLKPLFDDLSAFTDHNYYVNKASALMTGSLALLGTLENAPKYLSRAYDFAGWYLDCRQTSEGQEGLSYTSYAMDLLFSALDSLERVTGNHTLTEHSYPQSLIRWVIAVSENANGRTPPISDSYLETCFFVTASVMKENDVSGLANWYLSTREHSDVTNFQKLVYFRKDGQVETPTAYTERTGVDLTAGVAEASGWGYLRTGWSEDDLLLVAVGNNSGQGHSHYDQNSFVLSVGGEWILSDPGYQDYGSGARRDYTLAWGHSTVTVDGETQSIKGGGNMTAEFVGSHYSVLSSDAHKAYADSDLTEAKRTYFLIHSGDTAYYVLVDSFASNTVHTYEWNVNAEGTTSVKCYNDGGYDSVKVNGAKLSGNELFAVGKKRAVRIAFDRTLNFSYQSCGTGGVISATTGEMTANSSFCVVISAMDGKSISSATMWQGVSVVESYGNEKQTGVKTSHNGSCDLILVALNENNLSGGGLTAAADSVVLSGLTNESFDGFSATNATKIDYNGQTLLTSDNPVSLSVTYGGANSILQGKIGTKIRFYAPNGIGGLIPDKDGYCEWILKEEKAVITVNKITKNSTESTTDIAPTEQKERGCKSGTENVFVFLVIPALVPVIRKKLFKH